MASGYLYGLVGAGVPLREAAGLALRLGLGKPHRAILAAVVWYGSLTASVLAFPLSAGYLLLIGFSLPCLLADFYLRTVLRRYCPVTAT